MARYLAARLGHGVLVTLAVLSVAFVLLHLAGDPTYLLVPVGASPEEIQNIRHQLGLDQPLWRQYVNYMKRALRGDLGTSLRYNQPVLGLVLERFPATMKLTAVALAVMLIVAVPLGVVSAVKRNSAFDQIATGLALLGQSMPTFWFGIVLILVFGVSLRWFPTSGSEGWRALVLPGVTLGGYTAGLTTRMVRSCLIEVLGQDYIRTARAKGLAERMVLYKHALRNAALPVVTIVGYQLSTLIGGALVTEQIFGYPGMARLAVQAINNRDFPVVQAFVVVAAVTVLVINLVVDLMYVLLDPRITYE